MYRIIFIDEVPADIRRFQRYVEKNNSKKQFEVIAKIPLENIDELIEEIFSENIDAIIVDYLLSESMSNITYTGVELVEKILEKRKKFPCFVLTSYDDEAVGTSSDVNIVYSKGLMNPKSEEKVNITFLERVKNQIEHYKSKISNAEKELNKIIKKSRKLSLTAAEEERLNELDNFLEKALNQESKIPSNLKKKSTLKDLHKLIKNTDVLLKKMDNDDGK